MLDTNNLNFEITNHIERLQKETDNAIFCEIREIAKENGLDRHIILNEKNIVDALTKSIPRKIKIHGFREGREINTISYTCPICNKHIGRENFCKHCGQALDWRDNK